MWRSILGRNLGERKYWKFAIVMVLTAICAVGTVVWWPQPTSAQPTFCPKGIGLRPKSIAINANLPVVEVIKDLGIARTGPHDDCERVTPLPRGTRAQVTSRATGPDRFKKIVPWSQLDYGAWIESAELVARTGVVPIPARLESVITQVLPETTEISFPLSSPTPIEIQQGDRTFSLTFHNTAGAIKSLTEPAKQQNWPINQNVLFSNPVVAQASWRQTSPTTIKFDFQLKPRQQWGYQMRYVGNSLVLSLRQPPKVSSNTPQPLKGIRVVVDPGHGAVDSGAVGFAYGRTYQEKLLNISLSQLLQQELQNRGAIVTMTRTTDINPSLDDRQVTINQASPAVAISIHHDASTPGRAKGASIYWYHPQSKNLAASILSSFSKNGNRPILNNNGVIQKSFAVVRPSGAPAVLLEVGFMTDPQEVTELAQPGTQQRLSKVLADGITQWVMSQAVG
jgi:N-acetylmuramoyl-L-alanine amidase